MLVRITKDKYDPERFRIIVYDAGIDITIAYPKTILINRLAVSLEDVEEYLIEVKEVKIYVNDYVELVL
jgi:hypothetical protein